MSSREECSRLIKEREELERRTAELREQYHRLEFRQKFFQLGGKDICDRDSLHVADLLYDSLNANQWPTKHFADLISTYKSDYISLFKDSPKSNQPTTEETNSSKPSWEEFARKCGYKGKVS